MMATAVVGLAVVAAATLVLGSLRLRLDQRLAREARDNGAPPLELKLGLEKATFPQSIRVKNNGQRALYDVSLVAIADSRLPSGSQGTSAKPDRLPLPRTHLLPQETVEAPVSGLAIPEGSWSDVLTGREILDTFWEVNFSDAQGAHTAWFCFEYSPQESAFVDCPEFRATPGTW